MSASPFNQADMPCTPAFLRYEAFSASVQRVGTMNPYDLDPYCRVGRNEMQDWCSDNGVKIDLYLQAAEIQPELDRLFKRLKREFPGEAWRCGLRGSCG